MKIIKSAEYFLLVEEDVKESQYNTLAYYPLSSTTPKLELLLLPNPFKYNLSQTFSREDMKNIVKEYERSCISNFDQWFDSYIKELTTQNPPKEFTPIIENCEKCKDDNSLNVLICDDCEGTGHKFKTIINQEGKVEIQGTYIY